MLADLLDLERGSLRGRGPGAVGRGWDYGKHASSVIGVVIRVLDPKGRGVLEGGGCGAPFDAVGFPGARST